MVHPKVVDSNGLYAALLLALLDKYPPPIDATHYDVSELLAGLRENLGQQGNFCLHHIPIKPLPDGRFYSEEVFLRLKQLFCGDYLSNPGERGRPELLTPNGAHLNYFRETLLEALSDPDQKTDMTSIVQALGIDVKRIWRSV